jgi:hypothetical protein
MVYPVLTTFMRETKQLQTKWIWQALRLPIEMTTLKAKPKFISPRAEK